MSETPSKPKEGNGVAIVLALTAVLAAVLAGRASLVSSSASGSWQSAVRSEVKRAAAAIEDIRYTYTTEAPVAFSFARANILSEEFRSRAEGLPADAASRLRQEAAAQAAVIDNLAGAAESVDARYATDDGGFDIALRLSDNRSANPDLVTVDPGRPQKAGDRASRHARLTMATTIPVAVAFLCGALAQGVPRRRRPFILLGIAFLAIGLVAASVVEVMV